MAPSGGDDQRVKQLHMEERREELKRLLADRRLGQVQAKPRSGFTTMAALTPTSTLATLEQWSLAKGGSSPESASIPAVDSSQTEQTKQQPSVSSVVSEASAAAHPAGFALQASNEEVDTFDRVAGISAVHCDRVAGISVRSDCEPEALSQDAAPAVRSEPGEVLSPEKPEAAPAPPQSLQRPPPRRNARPPRL